MLREELKERLYFEASVLLFSQEYARLIGFRRILVHAQKLKILILNYTCVPPVNVWNL